jgi:hypothetical protein
MILRLPTSGRIALATALAAGVLAGCGDDSPDPAPTPAPSPTPRPLPVPQVRALPLDTPRADIERRFGPPAKPDFVAAKVRRGEPKGYRCVYYVLEGKGGPKRNYVQFCFGPKDTLDSKLELTALPDGAARGAAPIG